MKQFLLICVFITGSFQFAHSQTKQNREEKIESLKIAFITEKLQLTSDEAKKFWPVYNDYEKEVKTIAINSKNGDVIENEENLLAVKKKYRPSFEKILGTDKMNKLFIAEREFRNLLIKRLKNRNNYRQGL